MIWDALAEERQALLLTRGLFAVRIDLPDPAASSDSFHWLLSPVSHPLLDRAAWFLDGSLVDALCDQTARAGFGIVVVAETGELIGLGAGRPPHWVTDAAAAELWAFYFAIAAQPSVRRVFTDCKGVWEAICRADLARLTSAKSALARTWTMIQTASDGCLRQWQPILAWMPAHTAEQRMHATPPQDSRGRAVTWTMWRANRLADLAAKMAARADALPSEITTFLRRAGGLYLYQVSLLGVVTHLANHSQRRQDDGTLQPARDSAGKRPMGAEAPKEARRPGQGGRRGRGQLQHAAGRRR